MTDGSERDEQCNVDRILTAAGEDFGRILFEGTTLAVVRRHTVEAFGQRSDATLTDEGTQRTKRDEGLYVVGVCALLVPGKIVGVQTIRCHDRLTRPDLFTATNDTLARVLADEGARGRDDRYAGFGEGSGELREGNGAVVSPAIRLIIALCRIVLARTIDVGNEAAVRDRRIGHRRSFLRVENG